MSEDTFDPTGDSDDLEMLEAIRAAFGDEAIEDIESGDSPELGDTQLLGKLLEEIDDQAIEGAQSATTQQEQVEESTKFIVVELGSTSFGIPMDNVYEIQRVPRVTLLPGVPAWIQGVSNLRGNVVSVVDLRLLLGLETRETASTAQRLVVTQSLIDDVDSGLIVDRVVGIRSYTKSQVQKPTASINSQIEPYLTGVVDDDTLIALLDIDKLLLSEEFRQFDAA